MNKNKLKPYAILILAIGIISMSPKSLQLTLRHQFIKPFVPFAHFLPHKQPTLPSISKAVHKQIDYEPTFPGSAVAKIVFRNPTNWNECFWIKLDSKNRDRVFLGSPALYKNTLVGMVDFIGKTQARVKLITNSNLTVSVRVARGSSQYQDLFSHINAMLSYHLVDELPELKNPLLSLKNTLLQSPQNVFLAKGEIFGSSQPLWRSGNKILMGRGFNASFEDSMSLARDLKTGKNAHEKDGVALIKPDDLLITTGLDGIFPEGLVTARVLTVDPLEEGAYYYSLSAAPIVADLDELNYVEIIEPASKEKLNMIQP